MKGKRLNLRLYIEGIEIPVISANVTSGENSPASAIVQIPPHDAALDIKARSMVHLFWLDYDDVVSSGDDQWKCIYTGEVISVKDMRSASGQRAIILQCMDHSSYWDTCYQYLVGILDISGIQMRKFLQAGGNLFGPIIRGQHQVVKELLASGAKYGPLSPALRDILGQKGGGGYPYGLTGGILRTMEAVGGVRETTLGSNDFFSIAEYRNKLLYQIGTDTGETGIKLFNYKTFEAWLLGGMQSMGQLVSFRQILNFIMSYIFYSVYPVTSPFYTEKSKSSSVSSNKRLYDYPNLRGFYNEINKIVRELTIAVKQIPDISKSSNSEVSRIPAAAFLRIQLITRILYEKGESQESGRSLLVRLANALRVPTDRSPELGTAGAIVEACKTLSEALYIKRFSSGVNIDVNEERFTILTFRDDTLKLIDKLKSLLGVYTKTSVRSGGITNNEGRLITQLLMPDLWFEPPPTCNVIFPSEYWQLDYNRALMRETSRFQLKVSPPAIVGNESLFFSYYYAPASAEIDELLKTEPTIKSGLSVLMDHERFTGIIPAVERMSNANIFAYKNVKNKIRKKGSSKSTVLNYAHKVAHFRFYKRRFDARQLSVVGPLKPYLVNGLPALVVSDPLPKQSIVNNVNGESVIESPDHYLGKLVSVSHSISNQTGGMTSATLSTARKHTGSDDEFLNTVFVKSAGDKKVKVKVIRETKLNAEEIISSLSSGSTNSTPKSVEDLLYLQAATPQGIDPSEASQRSFDSKSKKPVSKFSSLAPLKVGMEGPRGGEIKYIWVSNSAINERASKVLDTLSLAKFGDTSSAITQGYSWVSKKWFKTETLTLTPNVTDSLVYDEVVIGEEVEESRSDLRVPFEEAVRPGWFDDVYKSDRIGEDFYRPNIGCKSIKDDNIELSSSLGEDPLSEVGKMDGWSGLRVEDCVNYIYDLYKKSLESGSNDEFAKSYSYRPVATLSDVLGEDIFRDEIKDMEGEGFTTGMAKVQKLRAAGFKEGFHGFSVAPLTDLLGLYDSPNAKLPRLKPTSSTVSNIQLSYDVRLERWSYVKKYKESLDSLILLNTD